MDQVDLEKAQNEDGALTMVRSWFNETTGKIDEKNIDTSEFDSVHGDVLQLHKVRKQLRLTDTKITTKTRLIYLLEDEFESEPKIRIVIPPFPHFLAPQFFVSVKLQFLYYNFNQILGKPFLIYSCLPTINHLSLSTNIMV